jgi:hypothetical protein
MKLTLTLRYTEDAQRPAAAWLIPGDDPRAWLAELCRWEVPQKDLKLLVCQPGGLLVISKQVPRFISPLCRPYRVIARRLYLPIEAKLEPIANDDEIGQWLPSPTGDYLWHPTAGLIGYEPQDALRVSDLLAPLDLRAVDWDRAQPGIKLNDRLLSIEPEITATLDDMLREAGGDIGGSAGEISELPPHSSERGPAGKVVRGMFGGLASAVNWALKQFPKGKNPPQPPPPKPGATPGKSSPRPGAAGPSLLQKLQHWAARTMQQMTEAIAVERNKQLARLLQMLEQDPDQGLRYALPLAGDGAPRGLAPPGSRLTPRDPNFSLGHLGGGGPVDVWDVGDFRIKLMQRYRELANRELALGRHRRAAYIFAELLGDLTSAAVALESGSHFREAAALYDQRLNQPQQAARCLVKGQLWSEAIAIYERLGQFETIGDLYRQLDDREQAAQAYELAVDQQLQRNDYLAAANLLEHKLDDRERAYRCLLNAWPASPQGVNCLEAAFKLLARHERYDEADRLVRDYSGRKLDDATALQWIERLSRLATEFPHPPVRDLAADRTRVLAAQRFEDEPLGHMPALAAAVARLVPGDKLLARDAARFLEHRCSLAPRPARLKPNSLTLLKGYHLPMAEWQTAIEVRKTFYAAGWRGRELLVLRGSSGDIVQTLGETWTRENFDASPHILLAAHPGALFKLIAHPLGFSPLSDDKWFASMGGSFADRMSVGPHPGLTNCTVGVHYGDAGTVTCFDLNDSLHIVMRSYAGGYNELAGTSEIDVRTLVLELEGRMITQLSGSTGFIGAGEHLIICDEGRLDIDELPNEIQSLVCSGPYSRPRLAVGFEQGAMLYWGYRTTAQRERFAHDLVMPALGFTDGGYLIAAAEQGIEVYSLHDNRLALVARQHALFAAPLAVFSGAASDQFRILFRDGTVRVYKITP